MKAKEKRLKARVVGIAAAFTLAAVCAPLAAYAAPAEDAAPPADRGNPVIRKLNRGFQNTALGWAELPQGIRDIGERHGVGAAATWGVIHGTGRAIQRTAIGIFEMLTFPFGFGHDSKPLIEPEFVFQDDGK